MPVVVAGQERGHIGHGGVVAENLLYGSDEGRLSVRASTIGEDEHVFADIAS